jgi:hypothetical protein
MIDCFLKNVLLKEKIIEINYDKKLKLLNHKRFKNKIYIKFKLNK